MSWLEKIQNQLTITTGDGETHTPEWLPSTKIVSYNLSSFEFPNVEGTLTRRGQVKGNKFNIKFIFQGDDHLEEADAFEKSSKDPRAWNISHPYHGNIKVQPIALNFDNSKYNVTEISGTIIETIDDVFPKSEVEPTDKITNDKEALDDTSSEGYANNNPIPTEADKTDMSTTVDNLEESTGNAITSDIEETAFRTRIDSANAAILQATTKPLAAMRAIQAVINFPVLLAQTVQARVNLLTEQFNALLEIVINNPEALRKGQKVFFETNGTTIISTMIGVTVASKEKSDFTTRDSVSEMIGIIIGNYNNFTATLDLIQSGSSEIEEAYFPDYQSQFDLNSLVNFGLSNLFNIGLDAQQERSIILENDTNVINLTHRLYGMDFLIFYHLFEFL